MSNPRRQIPSLREVLAGSFSTTFVRSMSTSEADAEEPNAATATWAEEGDSASSRTSTRPLSPDLFNTFLANRTLRRPSIIEYALEQQPRTPATPTPDDEDLWLTTLVCPAGVITAPHGTSLEDLESALGIAFSEGIPRNAAAQIELAWSDYDANSFHISWTLDQVCRHITVSEGSVVEDFTHHLSNEEEFLVEVTAGIRVRRGPIPAPDSAIAALQTRTITDSDEDPKCAICQDEKQPGETVTILPCPCAIVYDSDCIAHWLRSNGTCPSCRRSVQVGQLRGELRTLAREFEEIEAQRAASPSDGERLCDERRNGLGIEQDSPGTQAALASIQRRIGVLQNVVEDLQRRRRGGY